MVIFSKLFSLVRRKHPTKELVKLYKQIHSISHTLHRELRVMHRNHAKLVRQRIQEGLPGGMGLNKTCFIPDAFVPRLLRLSKLAKERSIHIREDIEARQPLSLLEKQELENIITFLSKVQDNMIKLKEIEEKKTSNRMTLLEEVLRDITNLAKKFYDTEMQTLELARTISKHEISPLLKDVYEHPEERDGMLVYTLREDQLREIENEGRTINKAQDPKFKVLFRNWWLKNQATEIDFTTPLIDPHINLTIKLYGKKKKNVHLLLAA